MPDKIRSDFELDPRRRAHRTRSDAWEDVGALDKLNMHNLMETLRREHGIGLNKNSSILEVGTGKARLFKRLKAEGYDVTGVEGRGRVEHTPDLPIANIRIEEMPFGSDSATFDVVIAASVFDYEMYNQDPELMISRIADALHPGGIFVCDYVPESLISQRADFKRLLLSKPYNKRITVYQKI